MADELWWHADKGKVSDAVFQTVRRIETAQAEVFQRLYKLEVLYDPNTPASNGTEERVGGVHENAIASNVDTISAMIATTDVRVRQMTDGADWEQQRRARRLELYIEELNIIFETLPKCRAAFTEAAKKANGLVKVTHRHRTPVVEQVLVENIVVPDDETRDNRPARQLHEWVTVDIDDLIAEFPTRAKEIRAAGRNRMFWRIESRYFPQSTNQITYLESFRLPSGVKGKPGYRAGRHTKTLTGLDLFDEKWEKPYFPYGVQIWTRRTKSWYGISGAERIAGIQRALNKRNWHIEKQNDNIALPTTYVRPADANLATRTSKIGQIGVVKGDYPHTVIPQAVAPETYQSRMDLRSSASEEFGLSRMATHGAKPAGLDSGVALREFKDQTSDRYAPQEKGFEDLVLQVSWLLLDVCKELGADAPEVIRHGRFGARKIRWADVDMGEVKVQLQAASNLPRTPAGRMQFVIELAQAGVISQDSARRLLQHPDLESELSLYTAALESVERCIDDIAEFGKPIVPEPFMNFAMIAWRGQQEYLKWLDDQAPEDRLELLRAFVVTAAFMKGGGVSAANANGTAAQPAAVGAPVGGPAGMPALPAGPPQAGPPQAAFAPQAMQLIAGGG